MVVDVLVTTSLFQTIGRSDSGSSGRDTRSMSKPVRVRIDRPFYLVTLFWRSPGPTANKLVQTIRSVLSLVVWPWVLTVKSVHNRFNT